MLAWPSMTAPWWVPLNNPVNQLVFAETGASVDTVLIDGKWADDRHDRLPALDERPMSMMAVKFNAVRLSATGRSR